MVIITIDGPAGSGKSTAARALAKRLGFRFLDTGAMYRAVALAAMQRNLDWDQPVALVKLAQEISIDLAEDKILLGYKPDEPTEDVTDAIRTFEVTSLTHYAADNPGVREHLVKLQRRVGSRGNFVTEGRDQGTVVFPDALCKFFLTASAEVRARRRMSDLAARGENLSFDQVLAKQNLRDERDIKRDVGPMVPAEDAVEICTNDLETEQVVDRLEAIVRKKLESLPGK